MLRKKLGTEAIERNWGWEKNLTNHFKIPSPLIIPEGCEKIGRNAFRGCEELEKVEIPKSVEKIGYCAFCDCYNATIILRKKEENFKFLGVCAFDCVIDVKEEIRN